VVVGLSVGGRPPFVVVAGGVFGAGLSGVSRVARVEVEVPRVVGVVVGAEAMVVGDSVGRVKGLTDVETNSV